MRTTSDADLGARLTQIRGAKSRAEFAREMGVHKNTLARYENGETSINAEFIAQLVATGYNANWILSGKGPQMADDRQKVAQADGTRTDNVVDAEVLEDVLVVLRSRQDRRGRRFTPRNEARLVAEIYQYLIEQEQPTAEDRAKVLRLIDTIMGETNVESSEPPGDN